MSPMLISFLIRYGIAAAIGASALWYTFANPRIDALEESIAAADAKAAKERAQFFSDAATINKEHSDAMATLSQQLFIESRARAAAVTQLHGSDQRMRDAIASAVAVERARLPAPGPATPGALDPAAALGDVAQGYRDFGQRCAAETERLGAQVNALIAAYGDTQNGGPGDDVPASRE